MTPEPQITVAPSGGLIKDPSANLQNALGSLQVRLVLASVFLAYLGQMTLNPVITPLSREVALAEWQVGALLSTSALMVVLTGQFWGRRSQSWGRKPVLLAALTLATATMAAFAALTALGLRGQLSGTPLFVLFLLTRGLLFGASLAALTPTALALIANTTRGTRHRITGIATLGALQGTAMIVGAVVGGSLAAIDIFVSVVAVPLLFFSGLATALFIRRESTAHLISAPPRINPLDTRVWPFLLAGFGMLLALGVVQVVAGFLIQDRFHLNANATGMATGAALLTAGAGMLLAQSVIVPRVGWPPAELMYVGVPLGILGVLLLLIDGGLWLLLLSVALIGVGLGIAIPGFTAGATLLMCPEEQGGLAGLIVAVNGITAVLAPTLGTTLYGLWRPLPMLFSGGVLILVLIFVMTYPRLRFEG